MRLFPLLLLSLLALGAPALASTGQPFPWPGAFAPGALETQPMPHPSETPRYREAVPGEWANSWFVTWSPRFVTMTDIRGFDDAFARRVPLGMQFAAVRVDSLFEYRLTKEHSIRIRPTAALSYGFMEFSSHEEYRLRDVALTVEMPSRFNSHFLTGEIGAQAGLRYNRHEVITEYRFVMAARMQRVKSSSKNFTMSGIGFVDRLNSPVRNETAKWFSHQWSLGYGYVIGADPWRFRLAALIHPADVMSYHEKTEIMTGFGLEGRSEGLRLSDDIGLALHIRWDFWLPSDSFNNPHMFELGIGLRFS